MPGTPCGAGLTRRFSLWCAMALLCATPPLAGQEKPEAEAPGPAPRTEALEAPDATRAAPERQARSAPIEPGHPAAPTVAGRGLFRSSDLPYAAAFFGSLALVAPLEGLEREFGSVGDGNGRGADHPFYSAGAWAGNLWVDLGAAAVTMGAGHLVGSDRVARVGLRSLESLVVVDLLATFFKVGVGRQRPEGTTESDVFRPISWSHEYASFPSGHAAHAFALASTVSRELGGWTPWVAYPLAAGVGASRVIGRRHWPTDIVAGAALGLFAARLTARLHPAPAGDPGGARFLTVLPGPAPGVLFVGSLPVR